MKIKLTFLLLCFSCLTVMADNEDENGIDSIDYATEANATQMSVANATQIQEQTFEFDTDYLSHIYGKSSDAESVNSELSNISSVVLTAPELLSTQATEPGFLKTIFNKDLASEKYGVYTPLSEFEWTTVPLVAFGFIAKGNKKNFRAARNNFIPSYKNRFDDNLQLVPVGVSTILNVAGYQGRSKTGRYFANTALSYAWCALFVNSIKYTAKEMRPDGSTANSFPSGHTATAFTAATILHKEYGLTRSPWWSILGYGCATTTGIMRTLNNRHWISDILVGAGIGIISTDLGYMMADFWYKNRGIMNPVRSGLDDISKNPSFFKFSLGMQTIGSLNLPTDCYYHTYARLWDQSGAADLADDYYEVGRYGNPFRIPDDFNVKEDQRTFNNYGKGSNFHNSPKVKIGTGTTVGAEAAYFINPYIGAGVRARVTTAPAYAEGLCAYDENMNVIPNSNSASEVWSTADWSAGLHFALPLSYRQNIGAKILLGHRYYGTLDFSGVYDETIKNPVTGEASTRTIYGDNLYIDKTDADIISAGLQYTFAMGSGVAFSAFCDYDFSRADFYVEYAPFNYDVRKMAATHAEFRYRQKLHTVTIGAAMTVMF